MEKVDVIIIGAGAAGLMCAIEAGKRARRILVLEKSNKPGKKILMSGGGRCNFTNLNIEPANYLSHNPHFCKSALKRYTQWDFIELVKKHHIPFHEKKLGQLFCDHKSQDILNMLLKECDDVNVDIRLNAEISQIEKINEHHFKISSNRGDFHCESLVVASGGLSIPTLGGSPYGYKIAEQFNIPIFPTRAGLVPFTWLQEDRDKYEELTGISVPSIVSNDDIQFEENILFTHRGLSGPAILQISSYWQQNESVIINMLPHTDAFELLKSAKNSQPPKQLKTILSDYFTKRFIDIFFDTILIEKKMADLSHQQLQDVAHVINHWTVKPNGTEGYRTAEVTLGGVDCDALSSKTMASNDIPGLFFIGEVVDVTGWLGGYNFQWAWSSGWAAGQVV